MWPILPSRGEIAYMRKGGGYLKQPELLKK